MRLPSIKTLEAAFPGKGKEIRELLEGKRKTTDYKSVQGLEKWCLNKPDYHYRRMTALNEILEGQGIEGVWGHESETTPLAEYINMGDTYIATILYDHYRGNFRVISWGDWIEKNERRVKQ